MEIYNNSNYTFDTTKVKNINLFLESYEHNKSDYYFKMLKNIKHLIGYFLQNGIDFKMILLEDEILEYDNNIQLSLKQIAEDLEIYKYFIK